MSLTANILVSPGEDDTGALRITLQITNSSSRGVAILNPDMGVPSNVAGWSYSQEAYQTSLLISFGYLSMKVSDDTGAEVSQEPILSAATPALRPPIEIQPGDTLEVPIAIGTFYRLQPGRTYHVALEYGDHSRKVSASTRMIVE